MVRPPRLRPTFELALPLSPREVQDRLKANLDGVRDSLTATFIGDTVELVPAPALVHYWSPQLTLDLVEEAGTTLVRARFAPHPHVWISYVAVHALGALGTIGAAMFGISQYIAGASPWALWALPTAPVLAALVWALGFVGQGLGTEQMYELRRFVDASLGTRAEGLV